MNDFRCSLCNNALEEMGAMPFLSYAVFPATEYKNAAEEDSFIYRGLICYKCIKVFCPSCAGMQRDFCPVCRQSTLMPAYRGLLTYMGFGSGSSSSGSSSSGACFIATAVFDSYDSPEVVKLRYFRDHYLSQHIVGRSFTALYYKVGPFLASVVGKSPGLKRLLKRIFKLFL
jgi:hypothetical protein